MRKLAYLFLLVPFVLSACHPLYSAAQRIIVFARQVRREPATVR